MSKAKPLVFIMMGLALGYVCHRLSLLYDELNHLPVLDRWTYLLMNGQDEIASNPWNFHFTLRSSLWFLFGLGAMGLTYLYTTSGAKVYREGQEYGSARFGTKQESQAFASKNPFLDTILAKTVRLTLLEKKRPKFDRNKNLVVIGGSGAGKTFRFVKPNLIQANCTNIVVDPKDHLPQKTGKFFLKEGYQIKILDLVSMMTSNGFNPFRYVETENDLNRMLTVYFNNTKGNGSRSDPFWDEASMTLVRAIASYLVDFYNPPKTRAQLMEEDRLSKKERKALHAKEKQDLENRRKRGRYPSFAEISKLIKLLHKADGAEKSVLEVMFERYAKTYGAENFTMRNWADFQNYKDKTLDSVIAVTTAKFALFNIQSVIDLTKLDTMDIKSWGRQKTMVYLVIPDNDSTFRFLSALFFSTVFSTLTRQADVEFKGKLPIHVRAYLDEFANVGEIPDFAELTSTVRSRNISLVPILQNIAQLQGLYKEKDAWKTILGNCDSLLYLGGNDEETFKFMSALLGKQTIDVRNTSRSFGQTGSGSLSHQKIARDLMTPDEVGNMNRGDCLVRIANTPAFYAKKYDPFKHPNWQYLADEEGDDWWWEPDLALTGEPPLDLRGHRVRNLSQDPRFTATLK